jgi:hypothetical protein
VAPAPTASEPVNRMIAAHGGLDTWKAAPTLSFEDSLLPTGAPTAMVSRVTTEMSTRRAYLDFPAMKAQVVWDGEKAWSVNWKGPIPPRFLALLSFYFLGLPWLTTDPGVNLGEPGAGTLPDDPTQYITVKMSFGRGVGDTPDDYYRLFIDPETHRLKAIEFTVTYADLLPPGVAAIKEYGVYEAYQTSEGLLVPARLTVYSDQWEKRSTLEWRDVSFRRAFDESRLPMPPNAVVDASRPTRTAAPAR